MAKLLSPGKKLKQLRKKYGITQNELTRNGLKRTTLSMIETENNNLTPKTGALITQNINEILEERGIDERIDLEYLLESIESQIEQKLLEYIEQLDNDEELVSDVLEKINYYKYQLKSSIVIFDISKKVGDIYFKQGRYFEALVSYTTIFEHLLDVYEKRDIHLIFSSIFNCLACYYYLRRHKESLGFYKLIEKIIDSFTRTEKFLLLKLYLATKMELEEYNDCLEKLDEVNRKYKMDTMEELELIIIEAECNLKMKNYYNAKELLDFIKKEDDIKLVLFAKIKEAIIYADISDIPNLEKSIDFINEEMDLVDEKNIYKKELYYDYALCLLKLNRFDLAEKYLLKSIDIYNAKNYLSMELLINLYLEKEMKESLVDLSKKLSNCIDLKYIDYNDNLVFNLIYAYSKLDMNKEISKFIEEIRTLNQIK